MVPDQSTTSLVLECFCTKGDHIWQLSDEEVGRRCVQDLANKLGFIEVDDVIDFQCVRTLQAYPVYDLEYGGKIARINEYLAGFEGLHIVGRGGTHRYNNADHSIEMGLLLGRKRVLLFPPQSWQQLYLHPALHPGANAAQVNLDADAAADGGRQPVCTAGIARAASSPPRAHPRSALMQLRREGTGPCPRRCSA